MPASMFDFFGPDIPAASLEIHPRSPSRMFVRTWRLVRGGSQFTTSVGVCYRSSDGGRSWISWDYCWSIAADPHRPDGVYVVGGERSDRLYSSLNGGEGWEELARTPL